jgi:thioredoxin 1
MNDNTNETPIRRIAEKDFELEVLRAKLPVLVAFEAPWSRPCHVLLPVMAEVVTACCDKVKIFTVNVDDNPDLGLWYGIRSIPTLVFFLNGKIQDKIVGTTTKEAILCKMQTVFHGANSTTPPPESSHEI